MRDCDSCTVCCTWLKGESYGQEFGGGKSCPFLKEGGCGIYEIRPSVCRKYFCAWAQELLDYDMRPDRCGFLVSVEQNDIGQYLKVIEVAEGALDKDSVEYFNNWSLKMDTPVVLVKMHESEDVQGCH